MGNELSSSIHKHSSSDHNHHDHDHHEPEAGGGSGTATEPPTPSSSDEDTKGVNFADDPREVTSKTANRQNGTATKTNSRPPPNVGPSLGTFGAAAAAQQARPRTTKNGVMITDALEDVRVKYFINPKEIGHGHYGVVRKCMNRETKDWFAIKSIRKSKVGKIEVLKREVEILREVHHPHIVTLVDIYEDTKYLHLITELCTGGELFDRIIAKTQSEEGHFSEHDAADLVRSTLDAIAYCHDEKQIVHRDLKPENFLFKTEAEDSQIKIIDFGLSRHDDANGVMKTKVGTPYYVAPEVLAREYTKSCDSKFAAGGVYCDGVVVLLAVVVLLLAV